MINEYENTLRRIIIRVLGSNDDAPYAISDDRIANWKENRERQKKKDRGVLLENRLLYYSEFYDLKTVVIKNWELFHPILVDKKRFEIFFTEVENCRNTIAHGRNLISTQENLLKGISSDLKNLITLYHNKNNMSSDFFIEIIKINDNLGNVWSSFINRPKPTLKVGDEYELTIEANDPKDRPIQYEVSNYYKKFKIVQSTNRISFVITKEMIGKHVSFQIYARTPDSEYTNEALEDVTLVVLPE